jgi:aquaporin Z
MCNCKKYVSELIGTFLLVLLGCGSAVLSGGQIGWLGVSFAFGITLMACAYVFGGISGCHLNPAVTLALLLSKRFSSKDLVGYIASQLIGASLAGLVLFIIASGSPHIDASAGLALTGLADHSPTDSSFVSGILGEFIGTTTLLLVVLVATTKIVPAGFAPIAIGGTLSVLLMFLIPLTNASLNVARSFGVALFYGGWALYQLFWFAAAHIAAALAAVSINNFLKTENC